MKGRISKWTEFGYGYVVVRQGTKIATFYLHISNVIALDESLEEPVVGCEVKFDATDQFRRTPHDRLSAINAEVGPSPIDSAVQLLAGKAGA